MTFDTLTTANSLNGVINICNKSLMILSKYCTTSDVQELGRYIYGLREYPQITDAITSILEEATEEFNKL